MSPKGIPRSKRILDLVLTIPGLLVISPIMLILAMLVRIYHGRPVLFRQLRPGYLGKPFYIYKFRSMSEATDETGKPLSDSVRLTALGRFMRATSLDELPEFFQVLQGKMSLVGPRPLLMQYLELYSPEQMRRHEVLPGITGWAQINGRNALTWEDKFQLDVWYVDNWSLLLDIKILLLTPWKAIRREGINQPGHATAIEFKGSTNQKNDLVDRVN